MNRVIVAAIAAAFVPVVAQAAPITFEAPAYTVGAVATSAANSSTVAVPFTAQDNWSQSTSNGFGEIAAYAASGSYAGGQALAQTGGITYIGAKQVTGFGGGGFQFDVYCGAGTDTTVAGWRDINSDGMFTQNAEIGVQVGLQYGGFGIRYAGFGSRVYSGVNAVVGNWYHIDVALDDANYSVTMSVTNLTTNAVVDLNGTAAGTSAVFTMTAAQYGFASTSYNGPVARVTGATGVANAIDNINSVPEPATLGLAGVAALGLLRRRSR